MYFYKTKTQKVMSEKLVKIEDLYNSDAIELYKKQDELNYLVNQKPKPEWLKKTDKRVFGKELPYLPIERVEFLLTAIFKRWRVEIRNTQVIANSVVVTIRLEYKDPITGELDFQDGIGASPIQTDKDAAATDWQHVKTSAVMKAAPAAESFAVKDAAEKIGRIFGKDLRRDEVNDYEVMDNRLLQKRMSELKKKISELIAENQDTEQTKPVIEMITQKEEAGEATIEFYENVINDLLTSKL